MLGNVLVTKQTGPDGRAVSKLLIALAPDIRKELYLAVLLDRSSSRPVIMASTEGGMDIEQVAAKTPKKIFKESIDPAVGMMPFQARKIAAALGLTGELLGPAAKLLLGVYKTWWEADASLVEINPLCIVQNADGKLALLAVDAKLSLDDNALYRHPDLQAMRDLAEEAPLEIEASKFNLNYIKLDGNIACLVNGAGLAMATMDIIQHFGGRPANFLDVGGGASPEKVANAFRIVLEDPNVRVILVNIFAGINRCDWIAEGIVRATKDLDVQVPIVVRLAGTRVDEGRRLLDDSGLALTQAEDLDDAAARAVEALRDEVPA
jgi:succinyl-CoA synthetase beta subunit